MKQVVAWIAASGLAGLIASCIGPAAGKGAQAEAGFRVAGPVITALDKFRRDRGHYPSKAQELVPIYLPDTKVLRPINPERPSGLVYHREANGSFTLEFGYVSGFPSSINKCVYDSTTHRWEYIGYY